MGVHIDPAGSDEQALGIDFPLARADVAADVSDLVAVDGQIADERWSASAIDDGAAANNEVMHERHSFVL